jgi:PASTA domain
MVGGLSLGASGCGTVTEPRSVKVEAPYAGTVALACHQGHLDQGPRHARSRCRKESRATGSGVASSELSAVGLQVGTRRDVVDNTCNDIGTVLAQNPSAGTLVAPGTAVNLSVGQRPMHRAREGEGTFPRVQRSITALMGTTYQRASWVGSANEPTRDRSRIAVRSRRPRRSCFRERVGAPVAGCGGHRRPPLPDARQRRLRRAALRPRPALRDRRAVAGHRRDGDDRRARHPVALALRPGLRGQLGRRGHGQRPADAVRPRRRRARDHAEAAAGQGTALRRAGQALHRRAAQAEPRGTALDGVLLHSGRLSDRRAARQRPRLHARQRPPARQGVLHDPLRRAGRRDGSGQRRAGVQAHVTRANALCLPAAPADGD